MGADDIDIEGSGVEFERFSLRRLLGTPRNRQLEPAQLPNPTDLETIASHQFRVIKWTGEVHDICRFSELQLAERSQIALLLSLQLPRNTADERAACVGSTHSVGAQDHQIAVSVRFASLACAYQHGSHSLRCAVEACPRSTCGAMSCFGARQLLPESPRLKSCSACAERLKSSSNATRCSARSGNSARMVGVSSCSSIRD